MDVDDNSKLTYIVFASMILMKLLPQGINFSKSQVQTKYSNILDSCPPYEINLGYYIAEKKTCLFSKKPN